MQIHKAMFLLMVGSLFQLLAQMPMAAAQDCYVSASVIPWECAGLVGDECLNTEATMYESMEECNASNPVTDTDPGISPESYPRGSTGKPRPGRVGEGCEAPYVPQELPGQSGCPFTATNLKIWSDAGTWGTAGIPALGSDVVIPKDTAVLVTSCTFDAASRPYYRSITIPSGSTLVFADQDIGVTVGSIKVDGKLQIGSPTCRMNATVTITFFRPETTTNPVSDTDFGITVPKSGEIDIHGKLYTPSWTRLASTALQGSTSITLQDAVNWEAGQQIVVVTTHMFDLVQNQNEVMTIASVSGKTITLRSALKFNHYGGPEYQAEVGLLSRNILLTGDAPTQKGTIGAHTITSGKIARFSGVQFFLMGQRNIMGRYPLHFHDTGPTNADETFLKDSTFYRSLWRCVVVHGTNGSLVQDNVAFNIEGSCYYLESGIEENNVFDHNLAAYVLPFKRSGKYIAGSSNGGTYVKTGSEALEPSDYAAAPFWAANAYNTWTNNAASGGYFGYSFPKLAKPVGIYRDVRNFQPFTKPFVKFDGNSAHSAGYLWNVGGGCVYTGGLLTENKPNQFTYTQGSANELKRDTRDGLSKYDPKLWLTLTNTKVFLCNQGITHWGDRMDIIGFEAYDTTTGAQIFRKGYIKNSLFNAETGNPRSWSGFKNRDQKAFRWYDTNSDTIFSDATFQNFKYIPSMGDMRPCVFKTTTHANTFKPHGMAYVKGLKFVNTDHEAILKNKANAVGSFWSFNMVDVDGTACDGCKWPSVIASNISWWRYAKDCYLEPVWNAFVCPSHASKTNLPSSKEIARIDLDVPGYTSLWYKNSKSKAREAPVGTITAFNRWGSTNRVQILNRDTGTTGTTGPAGWYFQWNLGAPTQAQVYIRQIPPGRQIYFSMRYPANTTFTITRFNTDCGIQDPVVRVQNLAAMMADPFGLSYVFDAQGYLYLKLMDNGVFKDPDATNLEREGIISYFARRDELYYDIRTNLSCTNGGFRFCPLNNLAVPRLASQPTLRSGISYSKTCGSKSG